MSIFGLIIFIFIMVLSFICGAVIGWLLNDNHRRRKRDKEWYIEGGLYGYNRNIYNNHLL